MYFKEAATGLDVAKVDLFSESVNKLLVTYHVNKAKFFVQKLINKDKNIFKVLIHLQWNPNFLYSFEKTALK